MKRLADVNIESAMVGWLRETRHDVLWAFEYYQTKLDRELISIANQSSRIILTRDLDFGELVFREQRISSGIILVRLQAKNQKERLSKLKIVKT